MCKVYVINQAKHLDEYIYESRKYVARGIFYRTTDTVHTYKEKFDERNFDEIDVKDSIPPYIIHCRQPTSGPASQDNNNHPFISPNHSNIDKVYRIVIGCQVGFTENNQYDNFRIGQCDSESAIIALSMIRSPLSFCQEYVHGQLFFFSKNFNDARSNSKYELFMYSPALETVEGGYTTRNISGAQEKRFWKYDIDSTAKGNWTSTLD